MKNYPIGGDSCSEITVNGRTFLRIAINSPFLREGDDPRDFAAVYTAGRLLPDDILILRGESLAIAQSRIYRNNSPEFGKFTELLSRLVGKSPSAAPFADPRMLEIAMRECGGLRVFAAAVVCPFEHFFHGEDCFYKIAGEDSRSIFQLSDKEKSAYRRCVVVRPDNPEKIAVEISEEVGCRTMIADLPPEEDGPVHLLASSETLLSRKEIARILTGAPLRVGGRRVPLIIIRAKR